MNTAVLDEAAPRTQGGMAPPGTPRRNAVATDDGEKPPCARCGHTLTEHLSFVCQGRTSNPTALQNRMMTMRGSCLCTGHTMPRR